MPEAYLPDPTFAALPTEAEKYIGYPYVWGGHSPSTSFDCSGYLSYVLNQCGWDIGRLGAQGLYNYCTRTSSPRPGDLAFFKNTYAAPDPNGVTHCGLYVGDGWIFAGISGFFLRCNALILKKGIVSRSMPLSLKLRYRTVLSTSSGTPASTYPIRT